MDAKLVSAHRAPSLERVPAAPLSSRLSLPRSRPLPSCSACRRRVPPSLGVWADPQADGHTALDIARQEGHTRIVAVLEAWPAEKAAADNAMSNSIDKAVWQAVEDGNEAELRRLIKLGGDVNMRDPVRRHMPCVVAACILTHGAPLFP